MHLSACLRFLSQPSSRPAFTAYTWHHPLERDPIKHIWNLSTLSFVSPLIATHWLLIKETDNISISRNKTPRTQAEQQQKLGKKFPVTTLISDHSQCKVTDASRYITLKPNMLSYVIQGYVYACEYMYILDLVLHLQMGTFACLYYICMTTRLIIQRACTNVTLLIYQDSFSLSICRDFINVYNCNS